MVVLQFFVLPGDDGAIMSNLPDIHYYTAEILASINGSEPRQNNHSYICDEIILNLFYFIHINYSYKNCNIIKYYRVLILKCLNSIILYGWQFLVNCLTAKSRSVSPAVLLHSLPWMLASPENRKKSNFYLQTGCTRSRACSCNEPKRLILLFFD